MADAERLAPLLEMTQAQLDYGEVLQYAAGYQPARITITRLLAELYAQRAKVEKLEAALVEVAHHADDEAGFMVLVRAALSSRAEVRKERG